MQKADVEEILILIKGGQAEALSMKIYKDGTLCRRGCGGLPEIGISAMSFTGSSSVFDQLLNIVPQQVLDNPVMYQDPKIDSPLEYVLAFYGVSKNGQTGERAEWTKSTGIRFLLDNQTKLNHPLLRFIDAFSLEAAEITNPWYFDILVKAAYDITADTLFKQTFIATPKTKEELQQSFSYYLEQIHLSSRKWDLLSFSKDKTYTSAAGIRVRPQIETTGNTQAFSFVAVS